MQRLMDFSTEHARKLADIDRLLEAEKKIRTEADSSLSDQLEQTRTLLDAFVREAVTGGLSLESWGLTLLVVGVVLATWGDLIG